jgi:hypothetical protein
VRYHSPKCSLWWLPIAGSRCLTWLVLLKFCWPFRNSWGGSVPFEVCEDWCCDYFNFHFLNMEPIITTQKTHALILSNKNSTSISNTQEKSSYVLEITIKDTFMYWWIKTRIIMKLRKFRIQLWLKCYILQLLSFSLRKLIEDFVVSNILKSVFITLCCRDKISEHIDLQEERFVGIRVSQVLAFSQLAPLLLECGEVCVAEQSCSPHDGLEAERSGEGGTRDKVYPSKSRPNNLFPPLDPPPNSPFGSEVLHWWG